MRIFPLLCLAALLLLACNTLPPAADTVLWNIRLPRIAAGIAVGIAVAAAVNVILA